MSLINSMLAGLEDRQAYLSEGRNAVFEGLTSINDDNFHKTGAASYRKYIVYLVTAMIVLVSAYGYRNYLDDATDSNSGEMEVMSADQTRNSVPEATPINTGPAVSMAVPDIETAEQIETGDHRIALRMDYSLPASKVVPKTEFVPQTEAVQLNPPAPVAAEVAVVEEPPVAPVAEPSILAIGVDLFAGTGSVVKLELNKQAEYRIYELNKPDRVVVEFDEFLKLPEALPLQDNAGVISKIRGHHLDNRNKRTMLVFELAEAGKVQQAEINDTVDGHELVIHIVPVNVMATADNPPELTDTIAVEAEPQAGAVVYKQKEGTISRTRNQSNPDEVLSKGLNIYQKGQVRKGLDQVASVLEMDPRHVLARSTLVNMLIEQNRITDAVDILGKGNAVLPEQYDWFKLKAKLLVRLNRSNDAIDTLIKSGPDINSDPDYYAFLAALLQQQGRNEEAVAYYKNVVNARGDNGVWWMGLGISLERIGRPSQARDAYQSAINDQSLSPDIRSYVRNRLSAITVP